MATAPRRFFSVQSPSTGRSASDASLTVKIKAPNAVPTVVTVRDKAKSAPIAYGREVQSRLRRMLRGKSET